MPIFAKISCVLGRRVNYAPSAESFSPEFTLLFLQCSPADFVTIIAIVGRFTFSEDSNITRAVDGWEALGKDGSSFSV